LRTPNIAFKPHEVEMRDGMHGLITWGLSTLLIVIGVAFATAIGGAFATTDMAADVAYELTDTEQNAAIITAFIHASFFLVAAALSWWAATKGGEHRDDQTDLGQAWSFKHHK
jgi:hypothetical protein